MSHRKKAAVLLLGILVTIVLFLFFQALFMPKYMESMKEGALIAEYDKDSLNHEVVFIGDCEVYENFSPVTCGKTMESPVLSGEVPARPSGSPIIC